MWQIHVAGRGPIAGSERDHIGVQLSRERCKTLSGRRINNYVLPDASAVELAGADGERVLGVSSDRCLALWVGLGSVTHIGERDLGTSVGEQPPEGKRIAVVAGTVVRNDHLRHGSFSWIDLASGMAELSGVPAAQPFCCASPHPALDSRPRLRRLRMRGCDLRGDYPRARLRATPCHPP